MIEDHFSTAADGSQIRDRLVVYSNRTIYGRGVDVLIGLVNGLNELVGVVEPFTIEHKTPDHFAAMVPHPTITGWHGEKFLQAALDAAWEAGLRPTNWRDERPGEIRRMEDHLADMRKMVFEPPKTNDEVIINGMARALERRRANREPKS